MRGKVLVVFDDTLTEDEFKEKNSLFTNAAKKNNIDLSYKANSQLYTFIDNNMIKCHDSYGTYDYAIFFNSDTHLAKNLEAIGVRVVNGSKAIGLCKNKASMYQALARNNINIPKTVIFPTMITYDHKKTINFVNDTISDLGLPLVIKEWHGDYGQNVYLAKSREEVFDIIDKLSGKEILLQEFILESSGSDIRLFVIKNKVVASYRRQGTKGDFRSNLSLGGTMYNYIPSYLDEQLAVNAAKAVGCDFAIVDILRSINGPVVCEVNVTADVNNFYRACNVDVPSLLLKSIK